MSYRYLFALGLVLGCTSVSPSTSITPAASEPSNALLDTLAREDQEYRTGKQPTRSDEDRQRLVLAELARGTVRTPRDRANAAIVLQHTGLTFCDGQLKSMSPDNYLLAHHLAVSAYEAGLQDARYLIPQTIDRYLSFTEGYQKFGTNRVINQQTGKEELVPIDRKTTDAERARYGVPPLEVLLKQFPEQKKPAAP
jgi:hypothetical protein